ncbi:MAG TPA: aminotransferase class I/II-fold pyridoxal phosphate-dependent enzyme [Terriglobales bacterium]|nr:aminotransferase class I/II-fold pyridoxal phosphate-dependent enzyme [Terriglobales bacterium]
MSVSRRNFLRNVGFGAVAAGAVSALPLGESLLFAEPPRAAQPGGPILLNSNENAYGTFPSVHAAMQRALEESNRYPEDDRFVERVAALHKVKAEQVLAGCGSGEILKIAASAFTGPGKKLVQASPTFEALGAYARSVGAEVVRVPLDKNSAHDLDAMLAACGSGAGLVYICNPNNPTASLTPRSDLETFLKKLPAGVVVLMDEAYHHFVDSPEYTSFLDRPVESEQMLVARTFSKVYGLAGARLGYSVAPLKVTEAMRPHRLFDSGNQMVLHGAIAALEDSAAMHAAAKRNADDRAEFVRQAQARKVSLVPSQANFVMMHTGRPVREVIAHFRSQNILVGRPFPPMETYLRVSLGRPAEMQAFWKAWGQMPRIQ